jgi:hypothetical protein
MLGGHICCAGSKATHSFHSSNRNGVMSGPMNGESDAPEHPIRHKRKKVIHQRLPRLHATCSVPSIRQQHWNGVSQPRSPPVTTTSPRDSTIHLRDMPLCCGPPRSYHNCRGLCLAPILRCSHIDTVSANEAGKYAQAGLGLGATQHWLQRPYIMPRRGASSSPSAAASPPPNGGCPGPGQGQCSQC